MDYFEILLPIALILLCSKILSMLGIKIGLPQVVGMIVAGILLGFIKLIPDQTIFTPLTMEGLSFLAKIGVILILFSAGIETDLKQFKTTGVPSIIITSLGVIVPVGLGFLVAAAFNSGFTDLTQYQILQNLFYGTILSATSVSITVAALKELGKLNSKIGTSIIAAAILDDIIGIVLLSLVLSLNESTGAAGDIGIVIGKMIGFFAAAIVLGLLIRFLFKKLSAKYPHTRRLPILSFVVCFFYAYAAEKWFGVADITGAYIAGLMLSGLHESDYVDRKVEVSNYMIFGPIFFANIGITTNFNGISPEMVGFGLAFVAVGMIGKIIGCGGGALLCRYGWKDSFRVGVGTMVRAEVVLVTTQKGIDGGLIDPNIMPFILILIIATSLLTPLLLKLSYRHDKNKDLMPPSDGVTPEEAPKDGEAVPTVSECITSDTALPHSDDMLSDMPTKPSSPAEF